jgi:predicted RNA binding protein with dsRBD fold (UPF0201 family)
MNLTVRVESSVNPTEDVEKVERALRNLFPSGQIERISSGDEVVRLRVQGNDLEFLGKLRSLIKQERIRSAARSIMYGRTSGNITRIYLNKQAAFSGRVSFCEPVGESAHGPISLEINSDRPDEVIDYLASRPGEGSFTRFQADR